VPKKRIVRPGKRPRQGQQRLTRGLVPHCCQCCCRCTHRCLVLVAVLRLRLQVGVNSRGVSAFTLRPRPPKPCRKFRWRASRLHVFCGLYATGPRPGSVLQHPKLPKFCGAGGGGRLVVWPLNIRSAVRRKTLSDFYNFSIRHMLTQRGRAVVARFGERRGSTLHQEDGHL